MTNAFLRGPDPELFRTTYRKQRWYVDPLPGDDRWPATDAKWPSVSTVKKAWDKPFRKKLPTGQTVPLDAFWAAEFIVDHHDAIQGLDRDSAIAVIATSGERWLTKAAERGTDMHTVMERLAVGEDVNEIGLNAEARPFLPACKAFVAEVKPEWRMAEVVAVNRSIGFAGTADAVKYIPGVGIAIVDYKTRGTGHGCYEEDSAQIGGYSLAEYFVVVDGDGITRRVDPAKADAGLIVSLTADSYRLYPIDLNEAQTAFLKMYETWQDRRDGTAAARRAIGHPLILQVPSSGDAETGDGSEGESHTLTSSPGRVPGAGEAEHGNGSEARHGGSSTSPAPAGPVDAGTDASTGPLSEDEAVALLKREFDATEVGFDQRHTWLFGRVQAIKAHGPEARQLLAEFWSRTDVATFPNGGPRNDAEIDLIAFACSEVEGRFQLPFGDPDPAIDQEQLRKERRAATKSKNNTKSRRKSNA